MADTAKKEIRLSCKIRNFLEVEMRHWKMFEVVLLKTPPSLWIRKHILNFQQNCVKYLYYKHEVCWNTRREILH